jgi:hypothetical protein
MSCAPPPRRTLLSWTWSLHARICSAEGKVRLPNRHNTAWRDKGVEEVSKRILKERIRIECLTAALSNQVAKASVLVLDLEQISEQFSCLAEPRADLEVVRQKCFIKITLNERLALNTRPVRNEMIGDQ